MIDVKKNIKIVCLNCLTKESALQRAVTTKRFQKRYFD